MLLVLHNLVLVHRRIQAGNSRGNIGFRHLPCCVPQWKPKEARKPHNSSRKRSAWTGTPTLQGPSTAPAGPMLLKFWLKTRKSIMNKVTKFQIRTPNDLGARIEKPLGGQNLSPARNRVNHRIADALLCRTACNGVTLPLLTSPGCADVTSGRGDVRPSASPCADAPPWRDSPSL